MGRDRVGRYNDFLCDLIATGRIRPGQSSAVGSRSRKRPTLTVASTSGPMATSRSSSTPGA